MKIMKLLASCAIIGALASTTVMAAESDFLGEYNATDNSIAINLTAADVTKYCESVTGDLTILVTNVDAAGTITNTNIFQIDQGTVATLDNDGDDNTTTAVLKLSEAVATDYAVENRETDSVYYVRIGGGTVEVENTDGTKSNVAGYIYDTFKFAVDAGGEDEKPQVLIGNVDASTETAPITLNDCTEICLYINGKTGAIRTDAETINNVNFAAAAYCDGDDQITLNDCTEICLYINGKNPVYAGTTVDLGKYDTVE